MERCLEIPVLDKGYVKLISSMDTDISPVLNARVSSATESNVERDDKLREFLWKNQHTSVFESLIAQIEIKIPIFCLRQLERHRTVDNCDGVIIESLDENFRKYFSPNEQSGRYAEFKDEFYIPEVENIRGQSLINKQKSEDNLAPETKDLLVGIYETAKDKGFYLYKEALKYGASKEQARINLTSNVYTIRRLTGSFLNWTNLLKLRLKENVQFETLEYAKAIGKIIESLWPKCYSLFEEYSLHSVTLSRKEKQQLS